MRKKKEGPAGQQNAELRERRALSCPAARRIIQRLSVCEDDSIRQTIPALLSDHCALVSRPSPDLPAAQCLSHSRALHGRYVEGVTRTKKKRALKDSRKGAPPDVSPKPEKRRKTCRVSFFSYFNGGSGNEA